MGNKKFPKKEIMARKCFAMLLILLCLLNAAASGSDLASADSSSLHITFFHDVHIQEHPTLALAKHSDENPCCDSKCEIDEDCSSGDEGDFPVDCHHCHCTHFDSMHSHLSKFNLNVNVSSFYVIYDHFYLDEPISNQIKPPEMIV